MSKASTPSASVHFRTASNSDTCVGLSIELKDEVVLGAGRIFACFSRSISCSRVIGESYSEPYGILYYVQPIANRLRANNGETRADYQSGLEERSRTTANTGTTRSGRKQSKPRCLSEASIEPIP